VGSEAPTAFVVLHDFVNESSNAAGAEIQAFGADCTHFALVSGNLHRVFDDLFAPRLRINGRSETKGL
jgi:hypothetical protein